jgi:hypothetical protein
MVQFLAAGRMPQTAFNPFVDLFISHLILFCRENDRFFLKTGQKGGGEMAGSSEARSCCSMEKKRLMKALEKCNFCSDNYEEFRSCYRREARESGERARSCIIR